MMRVEFSVTDDGKSLVLTAKGHAQMSAKGTDVVCAAASILVYQAAEVVNVFQSNGLLKKKPTIKLEDGNAVITAKPRKDKFAELKFAFCVVQKGFELIAESYPDNVKLKMFSMGQ